MLRREQFIQELHNINNTETIEREISTLENYVDEQLRNNNNLIQFINRNSQGTQGTGGIEFVEYSQPTNAIHKNIDVESDNEITLNGNSYAIWNENLTYPNGNTAINQPWNDKTFTGYENFDGEIRIQLPENTNKNVAQRLVERYLSDDFDNNGEPIGGFWSKGIKPNDSNNNSTSEIVDDAVRLEYDYDTNRLYMIFKLF